ncbi:MAG: BREX-1 system phosphatase PglZ type A [Alphaproteobacteria bacterium]|nr:BREX-1 system phosphatase PglZ type A [Alphaproteobacteria bacterium]
MNETQIKQALQKYFEDNRIVLWYDDNAEFSELVAEIDYVKVINLKEIPALQARVMFDVDNPTEKFLLYAPFPKPEYTHDWFLDVSKYAPIFKTDAATLIMNDLGLGDRPELFTYFSKRKRFFAEKNRMAKFKSTMGTYDLCPENMDLAMLAIDTKAASVDVFAMLISLLCDWVEGEECDLDTPSDAWKTIEKHQMTDGFWNWMNISFGYQSEEPNIKDFVLRLFATDVLSCFKGEKKPKAITALQLPKADNAFVCLGKWRDSTSQRAKYDEFSHQVEELLKVKSWDVTEDPDAWTNVVTFRTIENKLLAYITDAVVSATGMLETEYYEDFIRERQHGYWASQTHQEQKFYNMYNAILDACSMAALINSNADKLTTLSDLPTLYKAYTGELYKIDYHYRHAIQNIKLVASTSPIVTAVLDFVEKLYCHNFIDVLGVRINDIVDFALAQNWKVPEISRQVDFYSRYISPIADKDEKAFVIISDGMRYEIADELARVINAKNRLTANIGSMLGVLPSYTALGMAALLPHKTLSYNANNDVLIDGKSTTGIDSRSRILSAVKGTAITFDEFRKMTREQGRDFVKQYNVIYIYHNQIDATGDQQKTEEQVFAATETSIQDIADMVSFMANNYSAKKIFITADHGFLFQYQPRTAIDQTKAEKPDESAVFKKRYSYGKGLARFPNSLYGSTETTAKTDADGSVTFNVPCGANVYNFIGGSRFVHGGAMPQEIIVPLIQIQQKVYGKAKEAARVQDVGVTFMAAPARITNKIQSFRLIQTDAVNDKNQPAEIKVAVYEDETMNNPITNVVNMTFDSESANMDERIQVATLTLISKPYDKKKDYFLRITNTNDIILSEYNVKIDLVYDDEF